MIVVRLMCQTKSSVPSILGIKRLHTIARKPADLWLLSKDPLRLQSTKIISFLKRNQLIASNRAKLNLSKRETVTSSKAVRNNSSISLIYGSQWLNRLNSFLLNPIVFRTPRWISPKYSSMTFSEVLGHASFILVAISYSVDDFLMLRIIAIIGSTSMLFFAYFHPYGNTLWLPFNWHILFIVINSYNILKLIYNEHQANHLPDDLMMLHDDYMPVISSVDFYKLVSIGEVMTYEPGDKIIEQGEMNPCVRVIIDGEVDTLRDGVLTYQMGTGGFMSEAGLHTGLKTEGDVRSSCTIIAKKGQDKSNVKVMQWDRNALMELLQKETSLRMSLKSVLSWDIIHKLKSQRQLLAQDGVKDLNKWTEKRNEQNETRYKSILHNILTHHGQIDGHKTGLDNYRTIHNIDDHQHNKALEECGWTPEEYEVGHKTESTNMTWLRKLING